MSHVDYKKSQYPLSLNSPCHMSPLRNTNVVMFRKGPMPCPLLDSHVTKFLVPCRFFTNAHVAVSNLDVEGHR